MRRRLERPLSLINLPGFPAIVLTVNVGQGYELASLQTDRDDVFLGVRLGRHICYKVTQVSKVLLN